MVQQASEHRGNEYIWKRIYCNEDSGGAGQIATVQIAPVWRPT